MKTLRNILILIIILITTQQVQSSCFKGEFQNPVNHQCETCDPLCEECEGSATNCSKCKGEFVELVNDTTCQCQEGYLLNSDNTCTVCDQCPIGKFNDNGLTCPNVETDCNGDCSLKCESCLFKSTQCKTCASGANRSTIAPHCHCEKGFHDNDGTTLDCKACKENCIACTNDNNCQQCADGYFQDDDLSCQKCYFQTPNICIRECPEGTTAEENGRCVKNQEDLNENSGIILIIMVAAILIVLSIIIIFCHKKSQQKKPHQEKKKEKKKQCQHLEFQDTTEGNSKTQFKQLNHSHSIDSSTTHLKNEKQKFRDFQSDNEGSPDESDIEKNNKNNQEQICKKSTQEAIVSKQQLEVIAEEDDNENNNKQHNPMNFKVDPNQLNVSFDGKESHDNLYNDSNQNQSNKGQNEEQVDGDCVIYNVE